MTSFGPGQERRCIVRPGRAGRRSLDCATSSNTDEPPRRESFITEPPVNAGMDIDAIIGESCARDWETVDADAVEPVRFAVVGLGWFTRGRALPALVESDRCEPTVLVSGSAEKAERLAAGTEGAKRGVTYDEFHDGAARGAYDAVYIAES